MIQNTSPSTDLIPPHNLDLEVAILGTAMLDPLAAELIYPILSANAFYFQPHGFIYQAIRDLYGSLSPTDLSAVAIWLSDHNLLVKAGGKAALQKIQDLTPHGLDIEFYARTVQVYYLRRLLVTAGGEISKIAYDTSTDIVEVLQESERKIHAISQLHVGNKGFVGLSDVALGFAATIQDRMTNGNTPGLPTGFYDLDEAIRGFGQSNLVFIAARPGMGKTAMAVQIAHHVASSYDRTAAIFSLEMSTDELVLRLASSESGISSREIDDGKIQPHQLDAFNQAIVKFSNTPKLRIDDTPGLSVEEIASRCRKLQSECDDLSVIFIDHLQIINYGRREELAALTHITKTLKQLAKELNVPVVALAQLSRGVEGRNDKRPMMSDIRACGTAEQDADKVLMLYRDEYYNPDTTDRGIAEVIIAKNRNGPCKTIKLLFEAELTQFRNVYNSKHDVKPLTPPPVPKVEKKTIDTSQRDAAIATAFDGYEVEF